MMTQYLRTLGGRVLMPALVLVALSSPASAQLGLANTPWPMFQHDAKHTGRSPFLGPGPVFPSSVTFVPLGVKIKAQPSIAADGTIFVGVGWKFCAVADSLALTEGSPKAAHACTDLPSDISASAVAVDVNGYVYLGDRNNSVTGFSLPLSWAGSTPPTPPNPVCRYNFGHEGDVNTSPAIGPNGTIYFAQGQSRHGLGPVVAIEPAPDCGQRPEDLLPGQRLVGDDSGEKWFIKADTTIGSSSPAVVKEGSNTFLYIGDNSGFVHKYQDCLAGFSDTSLCHVPGGPPGGAPVAPVIEVWKVKIGAKVRASPVVGPDGTVFIGSTNDFRALDPATGDTCDLCIFAPGGSFTSTAALAADCVVGGTACTIYVGSQSPGKKKDLFALKWSGGKLTEQVGWTFAPVVSEGDMSPFPVVAGDGIVYATIGRGVYAIAKATGKRLWSYTLPNPSLNHPSIGGTADEGILYVTTSSGRLYKFSSCRTPACNQNQNQPPTADPGGDISATVGQTVHFDATASDDPDTVGQDTCASFSLEYTWEFPDGSIKHVPCVDYTITNLPFPQTVTLTVSDGLLSDTATIMVSKDAGSGLSSINDEFQRPDCPSPCTDLGLGHEPLPPGQANWQQEQGAFVIIGGKLGNSLTKANHIAIRPDLVGTDLSASALFTSPNNAPGPRLGLILMHQGPGTGSYYVLYRQAGGTNALRIAKVVSGVETLLKSVPAGALQLDQPFGVTATAKATSGVTTLTLRLPGGGSADPCSAPTCVRVQDSTFSSGRVGIMLGTGSNGLNQYKADTFHADSY